MQIAGTMVRPMEALSRDSARQILREAGLRATGPRVAVLCTISSLERPMSHSEIVDVLGDGDWDQATIYRNLVKLVEIGLARVANRVGGIARYELRQEDDGPHMHPHFSCRRCGTVACLPNAMLGGRAERGWSQSLKSSEMQLIGDCPECIQGP